MDPGNVPAELSHLSLVEQQLISRISPLMYIHMLKHGGIAANGHCVTFPQNINEPCQILPKLPTDIQIICVRKTGNNAIHKDFKVRRFAVQSALNWLKSNNVAYSDITISQDRLNLLPENGEINLETIKSNFESTTDKDQGPAKEQVSPDEINGDTVSAVQLPDESVNIRNNIESILQEITDPKSKEKCSRKKNSNYSMANKRQ
jgi:hypothetical protein